MDGPEFDERRQRVRDWIDTELVDDDSLLGFDPERVGPRSEIFSVGFTGTLYGLLIDGFESAPTWSLSDRVRPSASRLFTGLRILVAESDACWVTFQFHDDAWLDVRWVEIATSQSMRYQEGHRLLQVYPAEQAGTASVGLIFEDFNDMFLITDASVPLKPTMIEREYRIEYFGDGKRLNRLKDYVMDSDN